MKLKEEVDEDTYQKIKKLNFKGIYGNYKHSRLYPGNSLASHILGYVNKEGVATMGAERFADYYLKGRTDGKKVRKTEEEEKCRSIEQLRFCQGTD